MAETEQKTGWLWLVLLGMGGVTVYRRVELRAAEKDAERRVEELEQSASSDGDWDDGVAEEGPPHE